MDIAIVEDNINDIKWLKNLFNEYNQQSLHTIYIEYYHSGEELLKDINRKKYQLIIMDIFMNEMDGIETAKHVQEIDDNTLISFLTTSDDEIWRAVKTHGCFDYIKKESFNSQRLEKLLDDVYKKLKFQNELLVFYNGKQEVKLRLKDIQYIVSNDKYTLFTIKGKPNKYRVTFSIISNLLEENKSFIICNRGIMLNMDFILKTNGDTFQMKDSSKYPIRRKDRKEIIDKFHDFQFHKLERQEVFE